jgi:hypothetical protein
MTSPACAWRSGIIFFGMYSLHIALKAFQPVSKNHSSKTLALLKAVYFYMF